MISKSTLKNILRKIAISTERPYGREVDIANFRKIFFNVDFEIIQ